MKVLRGGMGYCRDPTSLRGHDTGYPWWVRGDGGAGRVGGVGQNLPSGDNVGSVGAVLRAW